MANYIVSSGEVSSGIILETMIILDGGVASTTTVKANGSMFISFGGIANDTVMSGGSLHISSGGIANNTSLDLFVRGNAGIANGEIIVLSGGTANNTRIRGLLASPYDYGFLKGGIMELLENGIANNTFIESGGIFNISGGIANETSVGGYANCCDGPEDDYSIGSGIVNVFDGTANGITVNKGGMLNVSGGQVFDIIENGGYVNIVAGENVTFASNTISGLFLENTFYYERHSLSATVHSGTTVVDATIDQNGLLEIYDKGKLTGKIITLGGVISAYDGAIIDFDLTRTAPGTETRINDFSAITGSPIYTLTVNADQTEGTYTLANGASAFDGTITVVSTDGTNLGTLTVGETEIISEVGYTLLLADETLSLKIGEASTASSYTSAGLILDDKYATIEFGESFYDTFVKNGGLTVNSYGIAENTAIYRGGSIFISSGGTAHEIIENGGFVEVQDGAEVTFISNVFSNSYLEKATLHSGTTGCNIKLAGSLFVYDGGVANYVERAVRTRSFRYTVNVFSGGTVNEAYLDCDYCRMDVSNGGVVNNTVLKSFPFFDENGGRLYVSSGGTANFTMIESGGRMSVLSGGIANTTTVTGRDDDGNGLRISSGGTANSTTINSGGNMYIASGGTATEIVENGGYVDVKDGADVSFTPNTFSGLIISNDRTTIHSGTTATDTTVNSGGRLYVYSGGTTDYTTVNYWGSMYVSSGGTADCTTVNSVGRMYVCGGIANSATVSSRGSMYVSSGGMMTGEMVFEEGAIVSAYDGAILDFDISELTAEAGARVNNLALIRGTPVYTLSISAEQASGVYTLAEGAAEFSDTISVQNTLGETLGMLTAGETLKVGYDSYTLNLMEDVLSVTVEVPDLTPTEPTGTAEQVSWEATGAKQYIVEYSTDNFEHVVSVVTTGDAIDMPDLPAGNYQWRVKADADSDWAVGNEIVFEADSSTPKVVQSNEDGNDDLFFASASEMWDLGYYAQHVGSVNDWNGTNEIVLADGKGRIQNLFFGSSDPNVLCLTDGENGDAIFVDDVYTELPDEIEEHTARLYKIQEIRAGAGSDIVDMTSQRFEYIGDGLTIRGGEGNDTIWANKGDNMLFGDAGNDRIVGASGDDVIVGGIGNDRMHGGGGDDVFTFCDNWGTDTVEQLATGSVTLWFTSGSEANWNAETLTYTDGYNSVKVSGVTADKITLKFGDDSSAHFATLSSRGAFADFTSEKIFEKSGKGILA